MTTTTIYLSKSVYSKCIMGKSNNQARREAKKKGKLFVAKKPPKSKSKQDFLKWKTTTNNFKEVHLNPCHDMP